MKARGVFFLTTIFVFLTHHSLSAETSGDWTYTVTDNQATITGYSGDDTEVIIPAELDGIAVVKVGDEAFKDNSSVTNVTIPDSLTSIGNDAFNSCTGLTSVTIGNSVTSIGDWAFAWCTSLLSVTLPKLSVGDYKSFSLSANQIQFKRTPKNLLSESLLSFSENVSILLLADNIPSEPRFFPPLFNSVSLLPALLLSS